MADEIKVIDLDAPVKEVTLMEDRARVVRKGKTSLEEGVVRLHVKGIAPVVSDKTLLGRVNGESAEIVSTQVHREHQEVKDLSDDDPTVIADKIEEKQNELNFTNSCISQVNENISKLQSIESSALSEMGYDSAWNVADTEAWSKQIGDIHKQIDKLAAELRKLREKTRDIQKDLKRLYNEQASLSFTTRRYIYRIEALVDVKVKGDYEFSFDYVVPNACWRPCHTAILNQTADGDTLEVQAEGCVWQNTGERWNDVQLYFSTQRPSLGVEPPELGQDLLKVQKKPDQVVVQTREQEIQDAGMGQAAPAQAASPEMPGIDDGGEVLNLKAKVLANVPSDGMPYRVEMFTSTSKAETSLFCAAELAPAVILKSEQTNAASHPLLAGPVDLIRSSGKVGKTSIEYLAPNEKFELGWGPDPELRVRRWDSTGSAETKMLSSWETRKHTIHLRLSNIGATSRKVVLKERIPVSEIEQVEIDFHADQSTGDVKPDKDGFLTWNITIEPFGAHSCDYAYTVRKKKNVVGV